VIDNCGSADFTTDAGRACVEQTCTDIKLLPPAVQEATLAAARCMVACRDSC
jgi:hypothetical protein